MNIILYENKRNMKDILINQEARHALPIGIFRASEYSEYNKNFFNTHAKIMNGQESWN